MSKKRNHNLARTRLSVVSPPRIKPPAALSHHEQPIWDELVQTPWLTKYDAVNLHMYVCARTKYMLNPQGASNALCSRLKSLGTKLRFDDPPNNNRRTFAPPQTAADKYFDDEPAQPIESSEKYRERKSREIGKKYFGDEDDAA